MLKLTQVTTHYGPIRALDNVTVQVGPKEIVSLLGGNASGKSTTMKTILGIVKPTTGRVEFNGERIDGLTTHEIVHRGISPVPESRRVFARLTVMENLEMGAFIHRKNRAYDFHEELDRVFALFPRLEERLYQDAGTLSGGEQQMLAIGMALVVRPELLLLDEPLLGLSPMMQKLLVEAIVALRDDGGITVALSEQFARPVLPIIDYGYVIENGMLSLTGTGEELMDNSEVKAAYFGV